jgi:hypothetical protein
VSALAPDAKSFTLAVPFLGVCLALLANGCGAGGDESSRFVARVVDLSIGSGGGFGESELPGVVLGPPKGEGELRGSTHVLSLGVGGSVVLELGTAVVDGPGVDLLVFENAFYASGDRNAPFTEPGIVGVSEDGVSFVEWPCDPATDVTLAGCAGVRPVYARDGATGDPEVDGGDAFDLADIGVATARFVRIRDSGRGTGLRAQAPMGGFDLDAVYVVHAGE